MERMFDKDSFLEEITKPSEAQSCYRYFAGNLPKFERELQDEGLGYEEVQSEIRQCWMNLLKSCQRVGWTNAHLNEMARKFGPGDKVQKAKSTSEVKE